MKPLELLAEVAMGLWLLAVAAQALAHLAKYGLLPLPSWVARVDFTPHYYVLVAYLVVAAALRRLSNREPDESPGSLKE